MTQESQDGLLPEVVALDLSPTPGAVGENLRLAEDALREAKATHPNLRWAVLPELFTCEYADLPSIRSHAEDAADGPSVRFFLALARELDLHVAYGFPESLPDGRTANAANLVGPEDDPLLTYRKRRLVGGLDEPAHFLPGEETPVAEAGGVPVAVAICWDLMFPETLREAAIAGARLVLAPSAWESPHGAQYGCAASARALDNAFYVATANQQGSYGVARFDTPGGVYRFDGAPEGLVASVDLEALAFYRAEFRTMLDELGVPHGEQRNGVRA